MAAAVDKPAGVYASAGATRADIYEHPALRGVLVRVRWSEIEAAPDKFDFDSIDRQVRAIEAENRDWSLAVIGGGTGSPAWLTGKDGAAFYDYAFRGKPGYRLPLFWDPFVQKRLAALAGALAGKYGKAPRLKLVYVTQMTANGIEGHLNGFDMAAFARAGYTDDKWVAALEAAARAYAAAFKDKALAVEVHEINRSAAVPARVINELWSDPALGQRVGAALWWLSGRDNYQAELVGVLTRFPGDIYAQVIARSDQSGQFPSEGYAEVFAQARRIGIRYIEPWEYEFGTTGRSAGGAWDKDLAAFNAWADATFLRKEGDLRQKSP